MKQALLIIDVQNDYFEGGKMPLVHPNEALEQILIVKKIFEKQHMPIIYIQHISEGPDVTFFEKNTLGAEIHPLLLESNSGHEITVIKATPNSFFDTTLQPVLIEQNIEQLVITGMMTHVCVDSTTRAAKELGYSPIVISDATATRDLSFKQGLTLAKDVQTAFLSALQFFSTITSTDEFIHSIE